MGTRVEGGDLEARLLLQIRTVRESYRSAVHSLRLMPAEHRALAIEEMRKRALELLEPLRAELGSRASEAIERELLDTLNEIERTA
jgi:hypothetical protein